MENRQPVLGRLNNLARVSTGGPPPMGERLDRRKLFLKADLLRDYLAAVFISPAMRAHVFSIE